MRFLGASSPVLALLAFALLLRALGLRLGLPFIHHWDEIWIKDSAATMLRLHYDYPNSYHYGAPLMRMVVAGFHVAQLFAGRFLSFEEDILLYFIARIAVVLVAASGVVGMYLAGFHATKEARWPRQRLLQGLGAALLYATAKELVTHGRYGVTDACLVACAAWALGFSAWYVRSGKIRHLVAAALAAGVGVAFKVPGLPLVLIPLGSALVRRPEGRGRAVQLGLALAVPLMATAVFFWLNPHFIDRWPQAKGDVLSRIQQTRTGGFPKFLLRKPGLPHLASALWALATLVLHEWRTFALGLTACSLFGLGSATLKRERFVLVAVGYAVFAIANMALPNKTFLVRNYLIAVPVIALGFGLGLAQLARLARRTWIGRAALAAPLVFLCASSLDKAWKNQLRSVDPRLRAMLLVEELNPSRTPTVALTPSVVGGTALGGHREATRAIHRPFVRIYPREVKTAEGAVASGADYVLSASFRDLERLSPYEEQWYFRSVPGYRMIAAFGPNPFEHDFDVTASWDGRVSVVLLAKNR